MCRRDIRDGGDGVWYYRPSSHKCEHFGKQRVIPLGPHAQRVMRVWSDGLPAYQDWLFPGKDAGPIKRTTYTQAVRRVQREHGLTRWNPAQIRHSYATRAERELGSRAASTLLGHSSGRMLEVYVDQPGESEAGQWAASIG